MGKAGRGVRGRRGAVRGGFADRLADLGGAGCAGRGGDASLFDKRTKPVSAGELSAGRQGGVGADPVRSGLCREYARSAVARRQPRKARERHRPFAVVRRGRRLGRLRGAPYDRPDHLRAAARDASRTAQRANGTDKQTDGATKDTIRICGCCWPWLSSSGVRRETP